MQGYNLIPPVDTSGRDAITVKIKIGGWLPHLSTDRIHFRADTTKPLGEHLRQVFKNSDQWARRRCDNEKKFTDGRTPDGPLWDKLYLSVELKMCLRTWYSNIWATTWSEYSRCAQWVAKDPRFLHADSEDSDQTGRMPRLIWVFAGRSHFVGFLVIGLI